MAIRSRVIVYYTDEEYRDLKDFAASKGLDVKSYLKFAAQDYMGCEEATKGKKTIQLSVSNYDELQNYVDVKGLGTIGTFANYAMKGVMSRNQLSRAQSSKGGK